MPVKELIQCHRRRDGVEEKRRGQAHNLFDYYMFLSNSSPNDVLLL